MSVKLLPLRSLVACVAAVAGVALAWLPAAQAQPKPATWLCQANHAMECSKKGCRLEKNYSASIAFDRVRRKIEICLYSQCLTGAARTVRGKGTDLEEIWVRARSKPGTVNPVTVVLLVRFDWRRKRFLLSRPGRIFHGGPCRPQ